ncbi:Similar to chchd4-a: Mitochondrial intermembrane space import and assembly protein 40-A (Xenopus laevis) [Cotesia congregata]|uniref:Similar to chchd4-a: Mitochondrial intermembrane space import and assembly protein 40-A (Xenopus laevis) n=1 Tax=Cotesia congregata TaxID=51543 RepID=A0A8J2EB51_COTCN|nr:Similar to chchd4-a: Mitochondrial intermembrane space import and assembly protein 40-A (Xenopus laevis) [Cotesia congregata]
MSANNKEEKDSNNLSFNKEEKPPASKNNQSESESSPGLILSSGEINWDCPCLDGMASGPCGSEFKESFLCMFNSNTNEEQDNLECLTSFKNLFTCMSEYPDFYREKGFSEDLLSMKKEPEKSAENEEDDKKKNQKQNKNDKTESKE